MSASPKAVTLIVIKLPLRDLCLGDEGAELGSLKRRTLGLIGIDLDTEKL